MQVINYLHASASDSPEISCDENLQHAPHTKAVNLILEGRVEYDAEPGGCISLAVTAQSALILFLTAYLNHNDCHEPSATYYVELVTTTSDNPILKTIFKPPRVKLTHKAVTDYNVQLPLLIRDDKPYLIHAGLSTVCRQLILQHHTHRPEYGFQHLLGFRQTCLKSCSQVSVWTDFVESQLPRLLTSNDQAFMADRLRFLQLSLEESQQQSYKRSYFKDCEAGILGKYYQQLNYSTPRQRFLTGHLPSLVDVLTLAALTLIPDALSIRPFVYPSLPPWIKSMLELPLAAEALSTILPDGLKALRDFTTTFDGNSTQAETTDKITRMVGDLALQHGQAHPQRVSKPSISTTTHIIEKVSHLFSSPSIVDNLKSIDWTKLPSALHPGRGGDLPTERATAKCQQLQNMYHHINTLLARSQGMSRTTLVDFCAGGGHVGLLVAYLHPEVNVFLVENKEESLAKAAKRVNELALLNITLIQCNLTSFSGRFDVGVCLHACGLATDLVLETCTRMGAMFVVCPCCYGSLHNTASVEFPRSEEFKGLLDSQESLTLGHAADKTEQGTEQLFLGKRCMALVDIDRRLHAVAQGYTVDLYSMNPLGCSPKNNILVGSKDWV